jgi:hypothetical protein
MAGSPPGVRGSAVQALYPVTRTVSFLTRVQRFADATEQRWMLRAPMTKLSLPYGSLLATDKNNQVSFFASQKGRFDTTISVTLGANTYTNMTLLSDVFSVRNGAPLQYDTQIDLRQVKNSGFIWSNPVGPAFPTLSVGVRCQMPFTQTSRYLTAVNDQETGMRYSEAFYGAGFSKFPVSSLKEWALEYPHLSEADVAILESFAMTVGGRYWTFAFIDPLDGSSHPKCRLGSDDFILRYSGPNDVALSLQIIETN